MSNQSATILNVDDNEIGRYAVTRILTSAGFNVIEASTGQQCLELAESNHPDLIILDVQLPDINGFDVCRQLKTNPATADIVVLHLSASFVNSHDRAFGLEEGADGYLTQPVEPPVLIGHIKALLRMRQAEHVAQERSVQWQTTFDAISDAIFLVDKSGRILQCNQAMSDLVGRPVAEICGLLVDDISRSEPNFPLLSLDMLNSRQIDEIKVSERWFLVTSDVIRNAAELSGKVYALTDITIRKIVEEENIRLLQETQKASAQQRTFMRDMLSSVTDGKLNLCDTEQDLPLRLPEVDQEIFLEISNLSKLRAVVSNALREVGFSDDNIHTTVTSVNEAASNAIVHAGGGTVRIFRDSQNHIIQFWVQDSGHGIEVEKLPRATLQRGYTTSGTFGHGFKIVIYASDAVWRPTGTNGTTVVIQQVLGK